MGDQQGLRLCPLQIRVITWVPRRTAVARRPVDQDRLVTQGSVAIPSIRRRHDRPLPDPLRRADYPSSRYAYVG